MSWFGNTPLHTLFHILLRNMLFTCGIISYCKVFFKKMYFIVRKLTFKSYTHKKIVLMNYIKKSYKIVSARIILSMKQDLRKIKNFQKITLWKIK